MKTNLKQFVQLRQQLQQERASLQARLTEIDRALGQSAPIPAPSPAPAAPAPKKWFSDATIAKMRASQQARWAKKGVAEKAVAPVKAPKKAKRKISAAGMANIIAATKARWDRIRAEKAAKLKAGK